MKSRTTVTLVNNWLTAPPPFLQEHEPRAALSIQRGPESCRTFHTCLVRRHECDCELSGCTPSTMENPRNAWQWISVLLGRISSAVFKG